MNNFHTTIFLSLIFLFSVQMNVHAKPIKFAGLDWSMNKSKIEEELIGKGYSCEYRLLQEETDCKKNNSEIKITSRVMHFNCHSFEGCQANINFLTKEVSDKYSIFMSYMPHRRKLQMSHYCGDGEDGDKICLVDFSLIGKGVTVFLYKGSFGSNPNF